MERAVFPVDHGEPGRRITAAINYEYLFDQPEYESAANLQLVICSFVPLLNNIVFCRKSYRYNVGSSKTIRCPNGLAESSLIISKNSPICSLPIQPSNCANGGYINKSVFIDGQSNHVPLRQVQICDSMGRIIQNYNPYTLQPPVFDYGYLKHFTDKTAEEYCNKIKRGQPGKHPHDVNDRIEKFFELNKFTEEKLKIFKEQFNGQFNADKYSNRHEG